MKAPVSWMAKNHVAANLLMGFIMLSGLFAMMQTKKETFPEMSLDQIQIQVPYLGATPAEVEDAVCKRIEERVRGLEGVRRVRSTASEGMGSVSIELERGADMDKLLDDIKNEIDRIDTFPAEIEEPVIKELTRRNQTIDVVLYGDVEEKALKVAAELVRDDLRNSGVISQVELKGVRVDEIAVEVSEEALRRYGLTFAQVADAVRRTSIDLPAGSVESEDGAILLRTQGLMRVGREYEEVVVLTRPDGTALKLKDVATVVDGFEDTDLVSRFNGQPAAVVQVYRIGDQNALDISDYVHQYIEDKRSTLPAGIDIGYARDDARILRGRIDLLIRNARLGLVLVFICLSFFLDLRLAFWVMMGIPISFLGAFVLMQPFDASINMLSLFAFIVALGIVVDDAIIVGENIFSHRIKGKSFGRAAIDGALEVGTPVVFSIMTSIAAFMPLFFVEGMMGKFMSVIPVIVISVLLLSLIESLLILPAHLSSKGDGPVSRLFRRVFIRPLDWHARVVVLFDRGLKHVIRNAYQPTLRLALAHPISSTALALSLMLCTGGLIAGGHIKFVFMPEIGSDWVTISVNMPQGTTATRPPRSCDTSKKRPSSCAIRSTPSARAGIQSTAMSLPTSATNPRPGVLLFQVSEGLAAKDIWPKLPSNCYLRRNAISTVRRLKRGCANWSARCPARNPLFILLRSFPSAIPSKSSWPRTISISSCWPSSASRAKSPSTPAPAISKTAFRRASWR